MPAIPPNTTLYVKNLDTKIKKPELRKQLYVLFNAYGKVIDIVATRADGMRGQAFVVFRDLQSSTSALRALDGFEFYDRALTITYAKTKSKATIVLEKGPEALFDPSILASYQAEQHTSTLPSTSANGGEPSSNGTAPKPSLGKVTFSSAQAELKGRERKRAREEEANKGGANRNGADEEESEGEDMEVGSDEEEESGEPKGKMPRLDEGEERRVEVDKEVEKGGAEEEEMELADSEAEADDEPAFGPPLAKSGTTPNPILFLPSLSPSITSEMLTSVFSTYEGFKNVELHPGTTQVGTEVEPEKKGRRSSRRSTKASTAASEVEKEKEGKGHAFVVFEDVKGAGKAKEVVDGSEVEGLGKVDVLWAARE